MSNANPILQGRVDPSSPDTIRKFGLDVAALIDNPLNEVYATAAAQVGGDRLVTFQVRDRRKNTRSGRHLVAVWASSTSGGAPSAAPTFAAPSAGVLIQATASLRIYITDANGVVATTITAAAGTWYFEGIWLGRPKESSLVWV